MPSTIILTHDDYDGKNISACVLEGLAEVKRGFRTQLCSTTNINQQLSYTSMVR